PINQKNKQQFNFLPLVKYLYFIFRITPTIDIEPKNLRLAFAKPKVFGFYSKCWVILINYGLAECRSGIEI
ncbi:hypothetical protein, partial [Ruminococcus sp.]